ncbi:MAG: NAD(P)H-dependent oxidoreductase, partial [Actinomycetota bacterium]|nr:NAD(P)H-dependent oxidoreductase [Actinomycetota bacterium]
MSSAEDLAVKILGVSGSPVRGGNVEALLDRALHSQDGVPGVTHDIITLATAGIGDCIHCNWCLRKQEGGRRCSQDDGMSAIYPRVEEADVLLFATPVYFGRP